MAITFLFINIPDTIIDWIDFILLVIAYFFLVIESYSLEKDERKFKKLKLLRYVAIILLIWQVFLTFIPSPTVTGPSPTVSEMALVLFFQLLMSTMYNNILSIILGISLVIFGYKNKELSGSTIYAAGILYVIGWVFIISTYIFVDLLALYGLLDSYYPFTFVYLMIWIINIALVMSAGLIFCYSCIIKRKLFITFSIAFLITTIIGPLFVIRII